MKKKNVNTMYRKLFPQERGALYLDALVQDDEPLMAELIQTCPRKVYEMLDGEFFDYLKVAHEVAATFCIIWLQAKMQLMAAVSEKQRWWKGGNEFEKGLELGFTAGKSVPHGNHPLWKKYREKMEGFEIRLRRVKNSEKKLFAEIKGLWSGLLHFCESVQLKPDQLLGLYKPVWEEMQLFNSLVQTVDVPPDKTTSDYIFKVLTAGWNLEKKGT